MDYNKSFLFLFIFLNLILSACSKNNNTVITEVKIIKGNASLSVANGAGGVILYGKSDKGDGFGKIIDPAGSGNITLELPNGNWEFYAFAWQGPGIFQGTVFCSYSTSKLSGFDAAVSVNLANANCSQSSFSPYMNGVVPTQSFPTARAISCSLNLANVTPSATGNECDDLPTINQKGYFVSYKVGLIGFTGSPYSPIQNSELVSDCIYNSTLTSTAQAGIPLSIGTAGAINLPLGGGLPIPTRVYAYYGTTDCDKTIGQRGFKTYDFLSGINSAPNADVKTYAYYTTGAGINLYLRTQNTEVCSGNRPYETPFAAGTGGAGSPFILCNPTQFNNINTSYVSSHFRLGSDLNFNWGGFTPIGGTGAVIPFSGKIYGDFHSIKNIIHSPAYANVGLIRQATNGVLVNNLTIEDVMFDAGYATAAAILIGDGALANTTAIEINNVDFRNTSLFAGYQVGTAIGSAQKVKLVQVHVSSGHVEGRSNYVGGLVGLINISNSGYPAIAKSDFYGDVSAYSASNVGGIVGQTIAGSDIAEVRVEGTVKGYSNVGGIVGNGLGNISNSYSLASVDVNGNAQFAGGIAGAFTGTMMNTFSTLGKISSMTPGNNGGLKGTGAGGVSTSYFTNNGSTNAGILLSVDNLQINSQLTGFQIGTTTSAIWNKVAADDTYDYPRLSWELGEEYYLPYLKRECSGHYGYTVGTGTYVDPKWVCTKAEFLAMNATPGNYILKRHIDLAQQSFTSTSAIEAVNFNLDGNGHMVANASFAPSAISFNGIDCNFGLFGLINPGQTIKNLKLSNINYSINLATIFASGKCWISVGNPIPMKVGTLAGVNHGTINNVEVIKSKIAYSVSGSAPSSTAQKDVFGGLVGENSGVSAMITGSSVDTEIALSQSVTTTSDDEIDVGGVAGVNLNSASINKTYSSSLIAKYTGDLYYNTFIGGIAGQNYSSATIYEVAGDGDLVVNPTVAPAIYLNVGGIVGYNASSLSNSFSSARFDMSAFNSTTNYIGGVVGYNAGTGSLNKTFYRTGYFDNTISAVPKKGIAGGNAGTVGLSFCIESSFTPANGFNNGSGITGSAISYTNDVSTNCLVSTIPSFIYSAGSFTASDGVLNYTYTTWNVTNDWYRRYTSGATWIYDTFSNGSISLIYATDHK